MLRDDVKQELIEVVAMSFETGHFSFEDYTDFKREYPNLGKEAWEYYCELVQMGPVGFYEEFKDVYDFDPMFVDVAVVPNPALFATPADCVFRLVVVVALIVAESSVVEDSSTCLFSLSDCSSTGADNESVGSIVGAVCSLFITSVPSIFCLHCHVNHIPTPNAMRINTTNNILPLPRCVLWPLVKLSSS